MSSVEVTVTREVPDSAWSEALRGLLTDLVYAGAEFATLYAPTDNGTLKKSLNPQSAIEIESSPFPTWSRFGPKGETAKYGGFLNVGGYIRKKRPPKAAVYRWLRLKNGADPDEKTVNAVWWSMKPGKEVTYHYIANPSATPRSGGGDAHGTRTKGWFIPGVIEALEAGPIDKALDAFAAAITKAWNR